VADTNLNKSKYSIRIVHCYTLEIFIFILTCKNKY